MKFAGKIIVPVHEYRCESCGYVLEQFEGIPGGEMGPPTCRKCNKLMTRLISASSFKVNGANAANGYSSTPSGPKTDFGS